MQGKGLHKHVLQTCCFHAVSRAQSPVNCVSGTDCCSGSQADFSCRIWATTTFWTSTDFFRVSLFFYGSTVSRCSKPLESFESLYQVSFLSLALLDAFSALQFGGSLVGCGWGNYNNPQASGGIRPEGKWPSGCVGFEIDRCEREHPF